MKYNWNPKIDFDFQLNAKNCTLDKLSDNKNLAFSFAKGDKLLIYVKKPTQNQLIKQYELEKTLVDSINKQQNDELKNKENHKKSKSIGM